MEVVVSTVEPKICSYRRRDCRKPKNARTASVSACFRTHILPKRGQNVSTWANLLGVSKFQPSLTQHVSLKRIFCVMLSLSLAFEVVVFGKAFPLKCCPHSFWLHKLTQRVSAYCILLLLRYYITFINHDVPRFVISRTVHLIHPCRNILLACHCKTSVSDVLVCKDVRVLRGAICGPSGQSCSQYRR